MKYLIFILLMSTFPLSVSAVSVVAQQPRLNTLAEQYPWFQWKTVGKAKLQWGIWDIYRSELKTPNGKYDNISQDLALGIYYLRNIKKEDLLSATEKQWQHLGYNEKEILPWITSLSAIWPNISKGDSLMFIQRNGRGQFYKESKPLGKQLSKPLTRSFISIWLSPKTDYPKLRLKLTGQ